MTTRRSVIAVIDDHVGILGALGRLLSIRGYRPELYASAQEFLDAAMTSEASCMIVDVQLGKSCGIELAQRLAIAGFTFPVIFMTADNNESVKKRAEELHCIALLTKPFCPDELFGALAKLAPRNATHQGIHK